MLKELTKYNFQRKQKIFNIHVLTKHARERIRWKLEIIQNS